MLLAHQFTLKPKRRSSRLESELGVATVSQELSVTHRDARLSCYSRRTLFPLQTHCSLLSWGSPWPQISLWTRASLWSQFTSLPRL